jgi:hypothetical protein
LGYTIHKMNGEAKDAQRIEDEFTGH